MSKPEDFCKTAKQIVRIGQQAYHRTDSGSLVWAGSAYGMKGHGMKKMSYRARQAMARRSR